jgi:hypothetical protein
MPRNPLEPKLDKDQRKALSGRLRKMIAAAPMDMASMARALEVDPEVVVVALRELRARKRGALRSTIRLGHVSWWWEDSPGKAKPPGDEPAALGTKKKRKKP